MDNKWFSIFKIFCFSQCIDYIFKGFGGHGELVNNREELIPSLKRAIESGKTSCINVKAKGVISPIVAAVSDKRDKASIE